MLRTTARLPLTVGVPVMTQPMPIQVPVREDRDCGGLRAATGVMNSLVIAVLLNLVIAGVVIGLIKLL